MVEEKIILLAGRTGGGKSTLANVLMGENKFKESENSKSETREIQEETFEHERKKYQIVDSIGIGDTTLTKAQVLEKILKWYKRVEGKEIYQVLFVVGERLTPEEVNTYKTLKDVFFDADFGKYTTIVRTRFPSFEDEGECKKDIELLLNENNPAITEMVKSSNEFIHVDNPPINIVGSGKRIERQKELNKEIREESRDKLLKHLHEKCQGDYKLKSWEKVEENFKKKLREENEEFKKEIKNIKENMSKENELESEKKIEELEKKIKDNEMLIKKDLLKHLIEVAKCQIL